MRVGKGFNNPLWHHHFHQRRYYGTGMECARQGFSLRTGVDDDGEKNSGGFGGTVGGEFKADRV